MSAVKMGLTIEEAAECTGIGRNTKRKLVEWGKLTVLKVGRKTITVSYKHLTLPAAPSGYNSGHGGLLQKPK